MEIPRHNVVDSSFHTSRSSLSAMCYGKRFLVEVSAKDLEGTDLLNEYYNLVEAACNDDEDHEPYEIICDWILKPCFSIFRKLAARPSGNHRLSVQDFFFPPTYRLRLFAFEGRLTARRLAGRKPRNVSSLIVHSDELPLFPSVTRLKATTMTIVPDEHSDDHWCEIPRKVCGEKGLLYYFKPALDRSQFIREVDVLSRLKESKMTDDIRISELGGIVISDDGSMTIGLVVLWIPLLGDLQSVDKDIALQHHKAWQSQITQTVLQLHRRGIVWGDVHPGNILIGTDMNAWVVDFGGGWVEPFLTRSISGTEEGDLIGIERVFEHLKAEIGSLG